MFGRKERFSNPRNTVSSILYYGLNLHNHLRLRVKPEGCRGRIHLNVSASEDDALFESSAPGNF